MTIDSITGLFYKGFKLDSGVLKKAAGCSGAMLPKKGYFGLFLV
jgi:hypothetical protein